MSPELAAEIRHMPQTPSSKQGRLLENVLKARTVEQSDCALLNLSRYNDPFDPEVINDMDDECFDQVFRLMIDYRRQQTKYFWHAHMVLDDLVRTRAALSDANTAQNLLTEFMRSNFQEAADTTRAQEDRDFMLSALRADAEDIDMIEQYGTLLTIPIMEFMAAESEKNKGSQIGRDCLFHLRKAVLSETVCDVLEVAEMHEKPVFQNLIEEKRLLAAHALTGGTPEVQVKDIDLSKVTLEMEYNLN